MTVSGNAKLAGVMGWPVAHSLSPRLHNFWLEKYGIDGVFIPLPVAPEIRICNHTVARAETLALGLGPGVRVINWVDGAGALDSAGIVVNTTTQGMTGQEPLDLDLAHLPREAMVYDIVYNPMETPLMTNARARGNPVLGGLGMLLHQAVPGFAAWFGIEPEVSEDLIAHVTQGFA